MTENNLLLLFLSKREEAELNGHFDGDYTAETHTKRKGVALMNRSLAVQTHCVDHGKSAGSRAQTLVLVLSTLPTHCRHCQDPLQDAAASLVPCESSVCSSLLCWSLCCS